MNVKAKTSLSEDQRLLLNAFTQISLVSDKLLERLAKILLSPFKLGQSVFIKGGGGERLTVYRGWLTEGGRWFYQLYDKVGSYRAGQYAENLEVG